MSDKEAIERLISLYAFIVDDHEWDRLDEVWMETSSYENSGVVLNGFAEIDAYMRGLKPLAHYTTNAMIDVVEGADVATSRAKVFGPRPDGTAAIGTYTDDLVRTAKGWRFKRRFVELADANWGGSAGLG